MASYHVSARRIDAQGSEATAKEARLVLDTDLNGRPDAFNPVELLLAALAACMLKGAARVAPLLDFKFDSIEVSLEATREEPPPRLSSIRYEIRVSSPESDRRLELLHLNILKYGTISNTLKGALALEGVLRRA